MSRETRMRPRSSSANGYTSWPRRDGLTPRPKCNWITAKAGSSVGFSAGVHPRPQRGSARRRTPLGRHEAPLSPIAPILRRHRPGRQKHFRLPPRCRWAAPLRMHLSPLNRLVFTMSPYRTAMGGSSVSIARQSLLILATPSWWFFTFSQVGRRRACSRGAVRAGMLCLVGGCALFILAVRLRSIPRPG